MRTLSVRSKLLLCTALTLCSGVASYYTAQLKNTSNRSTIPLTQKASQLSEVVGFNDQGQQLTFQIRDVEVDPKDSQQEIYLYTLFYRDANQTWQNLCHGDDHFEAKAIALQGSWDNVGTYHENKNLVTFSCANGALAKCARFGYKPWKTANGQFLQDYHQACVRMVRADYCGDGVGHTKDGTPINIYDRLGIQKPDQVSAMEFEATWGIDGAQSIHHTRYPEDLAYVQRVCPNRLAAEAKGTNSYATVQQVQQTDSKALLFNDSIVRTH